ncbi:MAG TPA: DUF805 domain-containing protein [Roseomonas sp.]|jgi:uncharacterized membrane protein YhaH (DUF805 family)
MGFLQAVTSCMRQYGASAGRASRAEYWFFCLFCVAGAVLAAVLDWAAFGTMPDDIGLFGTLFTLATFLPSVAVAIRRMHDIGKRGASVLIALIPVLGWILFIVWCCTPGDDDNDYGPNPLWRPAHSL